jgi:serine/threonine-protein kinase ATR
VPQDLQTTINSLVQAVFVGFLLNQALLQTCLGPRRDIASLDTYDNLRPWAIEVCTVLWQSIGKWLPTTDTDASRDEIQAMYMKQLETLAFPNSKAQDNSATSQRAALFITSGLIDLLQSCSRSTFSESNQIQLASLLARLRSMLDELPERDHPENRCQRNIRNLIMDYMEPGVAAYCEDVPALTSLHRDLQVPPLSVSSNAPLTRLAFSMSMDFTRRLAC